ncbi:MAG: class I SAM-dependent methyltransferase [Pseudomonadota bacterium]
MSGNIDKKVVEGFGHEWSTFDQHDTLEQQRQIFEQYFSLFPFAEIGADAVGFDLGCGSGRWAYFVSEHVANLHLIDPSPAALEVARKNLMVRQNCEFHQASVDAIPLKDSSMDFGYSLGVLHHVPNTQQGIASCVSKLKVGAPFLLYLYYAFDNRPLWFKALWRVSDLGRRVISVLPQRPKLMVSQLIAAFIYWPLARFALIAERLGVNVEHLPLAAYRDETFYVMRTDALDRFGTRLERRFTRLAVQQMMEEAGLERIRFRDGTPYWCALGFRRPDVSGK